MYKSWLIGEPRVLSCPCNMLHPVCFIMAHLFNFSSMGKALTIKTKWIVADLIFHSIYCYQLGHTEAEQNLNFLRAEIKIIKWKRAEKDCRMPFNIYFYFQIIVAPEFNKRFYLVFPKCLSTLQMEQQKNKCNEHKLDFLH